MTRDEEAAIVNRSDPVDGIEEWMCNICGIRWKEPKNTDIHINAITGIGEVYDRRDDRTNWPVFCGECI